MKPLVIGGGDASLNSYPWMVALYRVSEGASPRLVDSQFCAGVLVHPQWVLTAAHCVDWLESVDSFRLAFGDGDLGHSYEVRNASLFVIHPEYVPVERYEHDFALIRLESPITEIDPIPINTNQSLRETISEARIIGWGVTEPFGFDEPGVFRLQEADVPIVSNFIANTPNAFDGYLTESMIPVGQSNPLVIGYPGDSGGPLLTYGSNGEPWSLMGIASFGAVCSPNEIPYTIYGNIAMDIEWMVSVNGDASMEAHTEYGYLKSVREEISSKRYLEYQR